MYVYIVYNCFCPFILRKRHPDRVACENSRPSSLRARVHARNAPQAGSEEGTWAVFAG